MPFRPASTDEEEHPPALSGTPTAWITLCFVALLIAGWLFADQILCGVIRAALIATCWRHGERVNVEKLFLDGAGGVEIRGISCTWGPKEHRSSLKCDWALLHPVSPWRMISPSAGREKRWIREIFAGKTKLIVDLRGMPADAKPAGPAADPTNVSFPKPELLPANLTAGPIDAVVIGEKVRLAVNGLQLRLPARWPGGVSLQEATVDLGLWHRSISKETASAFWDGNVLRVGGLGLGEGNELEELTLALHDDRLDFGLRGRIGQGLLRGDGMFGKQGRLEVTVVGERLGVDAISGFLKDEKQATGTINQARFTFRGDPTRPLEADSAVRLIARNFRWEGRGWESLRLAATLTGRTLTLSELLLRQGENEVDADGESKLPDDWHAVMRAPFHATFRATLGDAGTLASLAGPSPWNLGGGLSFEGEIRGADNKAEGYCNFAGNGTRIRDLRVDWLKGSILFEGDQTRVAYLEASAGDDRIAAEGIFANSRPHAYSAKAEGTVKNLTKRLEQLGVATAASIGGGAVAGTWHGEGSATNHTGGFQAMVSGWVSRWTREGMTGRFEGSYGPGHFDLSKAEFLQDDMTLSMQLAALTDTVTLSSIKALRDGETKLLMEGSLTIPVDARDVWESGDPLRTLLMDRPLSLNLLLHGIKAEELADALGQRADFTGTLYGEISAKGTPGSPEINGSLLIGKFTPRSVAGPRDLRLKAETQDHKLSVQLEQEPVANSPMITRASLPVHLSNDHGRLKFTDDGTPIEGSVMMRQIPLDLWATLLGMKNGSPLFHASATGDLKFSGTVGKPAVEGALLIRAEEAALFGPRKLENVVLPLVMEGPKPSISMTNGTASYGGMPVALDGALNWGGEAPESSVKIEGKGLPISLGAGITTTGDASLLLSAKGTNLPVLGGSITMHPAAIDLRYALTPCFAPPGIFIAGGTPCFAPPEATATEKLQVDLTLKTTVSGNASAQNAPQITADLSLKGAALAPAVTGSVTAINQTLRLPCGIFGIPEAKLAVGEAGTRIQEAPAYGITRLGLCTLLPWGCLDTMGCGIVGPPGTSSADLLFGLTFPSFRHGDSIENPSPIIQGVAWLRQSALFPICASSWSTSRPGLYDSASLGFYGRPWIWNLSEGMKRAETKNTAR